MDKQTAIDLLDNLLGMVEDNHGSDYDKAIHMGIDALKTQDMSGNMSGTQKPLDCISRQAVINEMKDMYTAAEEWAQGAHDDDTRARAESCMATNVELKLRIEKLPSVQPESRREWYMKGYRDAQDAALHESCTDCPLYDHDRHNCPRFNKVIPRAIEEVKPRWIPVTEALPEKPFGCLVTVMDTEPMTMEEFENILPYFVGYDGEQWNDWEGEQCPLEVLAWMPIPEPWREGQDGTT